VAMDLAAPQADLQGFCARRCSLAGPGG